ncbi:hypothetical protein BJ138DRAFT_642109 [Hygrophoropsis aurantiaca]|uniref:Uncharacterized protein n=1 Tax=Hygrophoropsis aurantiaca TaxID=72124 RepID=A0ACB7ZZJ4_9AGAM|nr:hypothetical protein BJ138DRAFT_642109 [Hygrophoropsis aurantiaca]
MPSLRRSFSSPSVRSSPYPTVHSNSSTNGRIRANEHGARRSSGSATSERRVLADIEWWRVTDTQREVVPDEEERDQEDDPAQTLHGFTGRVLTLSGDGGDFRPQTPPLPTLHSHPTFGILQSLAPTNEFAALSIAPNSPTRRRHSRDSSFSSLSSTPEVSEIPLEALQLSIADAFALSDNGDSSAFPSFSRPSSRPAQSLFGQRSHSFSGFDFNQRDDPWELDPFSDLGGSSFSPDRNPFR